MDCQNEEKVKLLKCVVTVLVTEDEFYQMTMGNVEKNGIDRNCLLKN